MRLHRVFSGKRTTRRCDTGTNACHWFLTWVPSITYHTTFAWRSLTTGTIFPRVSHVEKLSPVFLYTPPPPAVSQPTTVCVIESISVCALTRIHITCTSTNYVDVPELPPSRPGKQPLVMLLCGFFWRSNRNHYLLVLVTRALAMSIHVRTYLPKFNNEMHYYCK